MIVAEQSLNTMTVTVKRIFQATAERVFDAWLDPEKASRFLFTHPGKQEMIRTEIDARIGGKYLLVARRDGKDRDHFGEYLEIDRPHRLVFTLQVPFALPHPTRVQIDITSKGNGCELTLTHTAIPADLAASAEEGWKIFLTLQDSQTTEGASQGLTPMEAVSEATRRSTGLIREDDVREGRFLAWLKAYCEQA